MQYQITSDNIEISDSMKTLAMEKFEKVESRLTEKEKEEALVRMVLNTSGADDEFRVKVNLSYGGKEYFGTDTDFKLESALIHAIEEVERMRKKDDISYQEDWNEQREFKHGLGEALIEEDLEDSEDLE